jgi:SAM-dependent methyltransferase
MALHLCPVGAAAHNDCNLPGSINVCPEDDFEFYRDSQIKLCGRYTLADIHAEADDIPLEDHSQDYIISHVIEHIPDPIGAFLEWSQLLRDGGIVFMIFPKRDALASDKGRPISKISDFMRAHTERWTVDTIPADFEGAHVERRGHYWVFTLESMIELIAVASFAYGLSWEIVTSEKTDDKVGNGHLLVCRFKMPEPFKSYYGRPVVEDILKAAWEMESITTKDVDRLKDAVIGWKPDEKPLLASEDAIVEHGVIVGVPDEKPKRKRKPKPAIDPDNTEVER